MKCKFSDNVHCVLTSCADILWVDCDGIKGKKDCPFWRKK